METPDVAAHLAYLTDSAHLLAETAPETSAHLLTCRNQLMLANDIQQTDIQKQHSCGACGHIMIPGRGSTLKIENERQPPNGKHGRAAVRKEKHEEKHGKKLHQKGETVRPGPAKVLSCGYCARYTKVNLPAPYPISRKRKASRGASRATIAPAQTPPVTQKQTANASSKKRAKNRKAGLQAMIEKSQANKNSALPGLGLSLTDFMKK